MICDSPHRRPSIWKYNLSNISIPQEFCGLLAYTCHRRLPPVGLPTSALPASRSGHVPVSRGKRGRPLVGRPRKTLAPECRKLVLSTTWAAIVEVDSLRVRGGQSGARLCRAPRKSPTSEGRSAGHIDIFVLYMYMLLTTVTYERSRNANIRFPSY